MTAKQGWISKTRGGDAQEIVRLNRAEFEVRTITARGDVIVEKFTMAELAEIGLRLG
jgi:hypothetical protein